VGSSCSAGVGETPGMIELTLPARPEHRRRRAHRRGLRQRGQGGNAIELIAAMSGGATLGPIAMTVERVGLRADFTSSGVQFGFKAPNGLGLSMDGHGNRPRRRLPADRRCPRPLTSGAIVDRHRREVSRSSPSGSSRRRTRTARRLSRSCC
jgi:hypothetical protein